MFYPIVPKLLNTFYYKEFSNILLALPSNSGSPEYPIPRATNVSSRETTPSAKRVESGVKHKAIHPVRWRV
jgi:hypothetical protein